MCAKELQDIVAQRETERGEIEVWHATERAAQAERHARELEQRENDWEEERQHTLEEHNEAVLRATREAHEKVVQKEQIWGREHTELLEAWSKEKAPYE